jgi:hypothetical protein
VEELEQRLLFSADLEGVLVDGNVEDGELLPPAAAVNASEAAPGSTDAAAPAAQQVRRELVFVDSSAPDHEKLVSRLLAEGRDGRQIQVVVLDSSRDGIGQISQVLAHQEDLDAVHFVSHGSDSGVQLGDSWLSLEELGAYTDSIAGWSSALSDEADLLFYGCDLAGGEAGRALVEVLSDLTGADVAASIDPTGSAALGGDWELEYSAGEIAPPARRSITTRTTRPPSSMPPPPSRIRTARTSMAAP